MSMTLKERVHIDHETGIVSVWHHGVRRPVVHSESGEHCRPVAVDIRAAIAEAVADARADEQDGCVRRAVDWFNASFKVQRPAAKHWRVQQLEATIRKPPPAESEVQK